MRSYILILSFVLNLILFTGALAEPLLEISTDVLILEPTQTSARFEITNAGDGDLDWQISSKHNQPWLMLSTAAGSGGAEIMVSVDRTGLRDFQLYQDALHITSSGGEHWIEVKLMVSSTGPILKSTLGISFMKDKPIDSFRIQNVGVGVLNWTVSFDQPWLDFLSPTSGSGDAEIILRADLSGIPDGMRLKGEIPVESNGGQRHVWVKAYGSPATHGGVIGLYADMGASSCELYDTSPRLMQIYVIHSPAMAASACDFAAPVPSCMTGATWIGDAPAFPAPVIGNSQTGISIGYGTCRTGPLHILTINVMVQGTSEPCCPFKVIPATSWDLNVIEVTDCMIVPNLLRADGRGAVVNPNGGCSCGNLTVDLEETTWGHIKSVFGD
jgi:hypothetical protein